MFLHYNPVGVSGGWLRLFELLMMVWVLPGCGAVSAKIDARPVGLDYVQKLEFMAGTTHLLVDDVDGDKRLDLALTSHGANYTQVFYQRGLRQFVAGPPILAVGYHPNDLVRLSDSSERLYLMNAEGTNRLLVLRPASNGGMSVFAGVDIRAPRGTALFHWPDWGLGLAVVPYSGGAVSLIKGFEPATGTSQSKISIPVGRSYGVVDPGVAADIDGDGVEELMFPTHRTNELWVVRYPGPGKTPSALPLWTFPEGAPRDLTVYDVTGDNLPDLLIPNQGGAKVIHLLVNEGEGRFRDQLLPAPAANSVRRADAALDKDGRRYVLAGGLNAMTLFRFFPGSKGQRYELRSLSFDRSEIIQWSALGDLDGDGWLDAIIARNPEPDGGVLIIYGPLWDAFAGLAENRFLEQPRVTSH